MEPQKKEIRLVLNRRKGFIKLALRFGVDLVPTFSFGEHLIFDQADNTKGLCEIKVTSKPVLGIINYYRSRAFLNAN